MEYIIIFICTLYRNIYVYYMYSKSNYYTLISCIILGYPQDMSIWMKPWWYHQQQQENDWHLEWICHKPTYHVCFACHWKSSGPYARNFWQFPGTNDEKPPNFGAPTSRKSQICVLNSSLGAGSSTPFGFHLRFLGVCFSISGRWGRHGAIDSLGNIQAPKLIYHLVIEYSHSHRKSPFYS